jgi:hypothetical protein
MVQAWGVQGFDHDLLQLADRVQMPGSQQVDFEGAGGPGGSVPVLDQGTGFKG